MPKRGEIAGLWHGHLAREHVHGQDAHASAPESVMVREVKVLSRNTCKLKQKVIASLRSEVKSHWKRTIHP